MTYPLFVFGAVEQVLMGMLKMIHNSQMCLIDLVSSQHDWPFVLTLLIEF